MKCINCKKFLACDKASENIIICKEYLNKGVNCINCEKINYKMEMGGQNE